MAETLVALHRYEEAAGVFYEILALDPTALDEDMELKRALKELGEGGPELWASVHKDLTQIESSVPRCLLSRRPPSAFFWVTRKGPLRSCRRPSPPRRFIGVTSPDGAFI